MNANHDYFTIIVAAVILRSDGKLLLVRCGEKEFNQHETWVFPTKRIGYNDTFEKTLLQELHDVFGLFIQPNSYRGMYENICSDEAEKVVTLTYIFSLTNESLVIKDMKKYTALDWFSLKEANELSLSHMMKQHLKLLDKNYPTGLPIVINQPRTVVTSKLTAGIDYIGITTPFYCHDGKGNFLFHKRGPACRDERGRWDMGAGQVEKGQQIEASVRREVQEEYGCTGELQEQLPAHSILRIENGVTTHWIALPFFVKINPNDVDAHVETAKGKITETGWFRLANLPKPLHTGFQQTFNKYQSFFDKYR